MQETHTDILIVGGGVGGCAAALGATALGKQVIMTEETDWMGGQLTSQAVPPDKHRWIESFGIKLEGKEKWKKSSSALQDITHDCEMYTQHRFKLCFRWGGIEW